MEATSQAKNAGSGCALLMLRVARISGHRLSRSLTAVEMRGHEFAVLNRLAEAGRANQRELGRTLRVHPSNLVALLDHLEREGLIDRRRDPEDRRRHVIELSAQGRQRLRRAQAAATEAERDLLSPLSAEERRQLFALLDKVADHGCRQSPGGC